MRLLVSLLAVAAFAASPVSYQVLGDEPGAWPRILEAAGFRAGGAPGIFVVPAGSETPADGWAERVSAGAVLILEADSVLARAFGFVPEGKAELVQSVTEVRAPELHVVWERPLLLAPVRLPDAARVFARERWRKQPLVAGFRQGAGAVLWIAAPPGKHGYERFPYLFPALADLGVAPPLRSARLWAFFDSSYRLRADLEYLARRWRASGIAALHVAAWHYWEPDAARDAWLARLIEACHRNAIAVYAWLELPHVSEAFWRDHPEWREQTALGQDAHLDWRRLMNLTNREAFAAARDGARQLLGRFDWDGVNLAELYFESLEGPQNPARFTPLNADVRRRFAAEHGFDPAALFDANSPRHYTRDPAGWARFVDFRAALARDQQREWLAALDGVRREKPHLDLVLTHIDDQFDPRMRELLGADTAQTLPLLAERDFTFLVEDPATIWNEGPGRYPRIAARYRDKTPDAARLAIDINIVERYQDVYPTKQQTGVEFLQLVHLAAGAFARVALYFENSLAAPDLAWLGSAAADVARLERAAGKIVVEAKSPAGIPWRGPARVNGKLWPVASDEVLWLPPGLHAVEPAAATPPLRMLDFSGDLLSAAVTRQGIEIAYRSAARAIAILDCAPAAVEVDGEPLPLTPGTRVVLPRGQHLATFVLPQGPAAAVPGRP
jgi:hypothetical protein